MKLDWNADMRSRQVRILRWLLLQLLLQLLLTTKLISMVVATEYQHHHHHHHHRSKRYLDFTKGSRMSWRCIVKNNILNVNTIWAYGFGFRANFPFPDKSTITNQSQGGAAAAATAEHRHHGQHLLFRRELFQSLALTLNGHGLDGEACLLKAYCTSHLDIGVHNSTRTGILSKLLKLIFTLNKEDERHLPYLRQDYCHQLLHSHCPLSFDSISPYTDI